LPPVREPFPSTTNQETASEQLPMRRPLLALAGAFAAGVLLRLWSGWPALPGWLGAALAVSAALASRRRVAGEWRFLLWLLAVLMLGWVRPLAIAVPDLPVSPRGVLLGEAESSWQQYRNSRQLLVRARSFGSPGGSHRPLPALVQATVFTGRGNASCPPVLPGDRVRLAGKLSLPRGWHDPGVPDRARRLQRRGISLTLSVSDCRQVLVEPSPAGLRPAAWLAGARERLRRFFVGNGGPRAGALVAAMVSGHRQAVPADLQQDFRRAGLAHLLAVSGLHLGMVALGLYLLLVLLLVHLPALALRCDVRRLVAALCLPATLVYCLLAGAGFSAVRAAVMVAAFLVAVLLGRARDPLNVLALAGLVIVALWPHSLYSPGFQLSFAAAGGIILAVGPLCRHLGIPLQQPANTARVRRLWQRLAQYLVVSLVAGLFTAPLVAYHFNQVAMAGPLLNLVAVPLVGWWIVPLGLLAGLLLPLSTTLASWLLQLAVVPAEWLDKLAGWVSALSWSSYTVPTPALGQVLLLLFGLLLLAAGLARRRVRIFSLAVLATALLWSPLARLVRHLDDSFTVMFIDVGQGDSTLVRFPSGYTLLVDGGPATPGGFDTGRRVVARVLWDRGITRLDALALTHPQADHAGGLPALVELFHPRELWTSQPLAVNPAGAAVLAACRERAVTIRRLGAGLVPHREDACRAEVLWPEDGCEELDLNERSLVLRVGCAGHDVLLTGDLEADGERGLLKSRRDLRAEVLKVGHHGSRNATSAELLERVRPRQAVISVGRDNPHGLPNPVTGERLRRAGVRIWRTDRHGAITVTLGPGGLEVEPFTR